MSALRRAINLILALALVAIGGGGLFYFYFLTATPNGWMALAAGIVGAAALYWLWDEHTRARDRRNETMPEAPMARDALPMQTVPPRLAA